MKITLVGSYNLADGYLGAANALKRNGVQVDFIPAHYYFSEFPKTQVSMILNDLKKQDPDIVLWWRSETLSEANLSYIKDNFKKPFILYSWDDPNQFEDKINNIKNKSKIFDTVFTCCEGSINDYLDSGFGRAIYCPPGFDPSVHYFEESEEYICDISLVCTNLYHGASITRHHHLSRKILMDTIIGNFPNLDIRIYGTKELGNHYPNNYKGWINFNESRKVFSNSKINICTHIRPDGYKYINERVAQILGSGGLLMVDDVNGIKKVLGENKCVIFDLSSVESLKGQIIEILNNKEKYDVVRRNGKDFALRSLSWDSWAKIIIENLKGTYNVQGI